MFITDSTVLKSPVNCSSGMLFCLLISCIMRGSIFKSVYINGKITEFNSDCSIQAGFCFVFAVFGRNDFLFCLLKSVKWHFMRQFLCLSKLCNASA